MDEQSENNEQKNFPQRSTDANFTIPEEVKPIIENLPEDQQAKVVKAMIAVSRTWRGPMPPPDVLKKYNDCAPNGADRILQMTEKRSDHNMRMEDKAISGELQQSKLGQIFAFIIAMSFLIVSGLLIYLGHEVAGSILGTIDLVALVTAFLVGRQQQKK